MKSIRAWISRNGFPLMILFVGEGFGEVEWSGVELFGEWEWLGGSCEGGSWV